MQSRLVFSFQTQQFIKKLSLILEGLFYLVVLQNYLFQNGLLVDPYLMKRCLR